MNNTSQNNYSVTIPGIDEVPCNGKHKAQDTYAASGKAHFKVSELDLSINELSRYNYCVVYAEPLIKDYIHNRAVDTPIELPARLPAIFLSGKGKKNERQVIFGIQCVPTGTDRFRDWINAPVSSPIVVVVNEEEAKIVEEIFPSLNKTFIILIVKRVKDGNEPSKTTWKQVVRYTTEKNLMDDLDEALERYVFSYLESALEDLQRSESLTKCTNTPTNSKALQNSILAILGHRGGRQKPNVAINIKNTDLLSKINKVESVHGCGFCRDVLLVYIYDNCSDSYKSEQDVKAITESHGIEKVDFRYIQRDTAEYATSGDAITGMGTRRGTLGGFLKKDDNLYAITAKHIADEVGQSCYTEDGHRLGEFVKLSQTLDIAVAQIDKENVTRCDLSLKDEDGHKLRIPCEIHNLPDDLQDLPVYIRGAVTKPGLGKIVVPFYQHMEDQHIVIENLSYTYSGNFCKEGDSGALVLGRAREGKKEVWAIGTIMGELKSTGQESEGKASGPQFLAVGLETGLNNLSEGEQNTFVLATQKN